MTITKEAVAASADFSQPPDGFVARAGSFAFKATIALVGLAAIAILTNLAAVAGGLLRGGQTVVAWLVIA